MTASARPTIERLRIRNYRVLRDVTFDKLTPLTVLFGPNGSGKSTVFDVFAFLHEAFSTNLRRAWDRRNRIEQIRSRGTTGPIEFELICREDDGSPPVVYSLAIDEEHGVPVVVNEVVREWTPRQPSLEWRDILRFSRGSGSVYDEAAGRGTEESLDGSDLLAVSTLGQLSRHPKVAALRRFISGWYLSYISADNVRSLTEAGPQERLSETGDNLPNVVQFLQELHPDRLESILRVLGERVPGLERVESERLPDGRLLLRLKDRPFDQPIRAKFISDGTLKLLAYLTVLYDPDGASIVGIEEPENQLHPRLLYALAEEVRAAAGRSQMLVTTHSPYFADALRPEELWALYRDADGFTRNVRASDLPKVKAMVEAGGLLGALWMEGYFDAADPLRYGGRRR
ncbi:MAG TPA: AAA family ATPase [Pseudonocardiaceae bacterium]|nr:AAA family ATPase [Pseudonocardiaceae bacterium]